jgi:hypothetical protein
MRHWWDSLPDWVEGPAVIGALFGVLILVMGLGGFVLWLLTLLPWPEGMWS